MKKMKKNYLLLIILMIGFQHLFAQKNSEDYTLKWLREKDKRTKKFFPYEVFKTENGYLSVEKKVIHGPGGFYYYTIKRDNDFNILKIINISELIDEKHYFVEEIFRFGEKLIILTSRTFNKEKKKDSYIQLIDPNTAQISERTRICSISYERKPRRLNIDFIISPNEEKLLTFFEYPSRLADEQLVGFQLFDKNINSLWKKEKISLKIDDARYQILDYVLNDNGEVFMLGKNFKDAKLRPTLFGAKFKTEDNIEPFEILSFKDGELISNVIKIQEIGLINFDLSIGKDNVLHGIGYFSENPKKRIIAGVLAAIVNPSDGVLKNINRKLFDPKMIKEGLSTRAKQRIDRKIEKGKKVGYDYTLKINSTVSHPDGSISFVGEVYYVSVSEMYNSATGTSTKDYDYNYGDLIVTRILKDGTINSITKIKKAYTFETGSFGHTAIYGCDNNLIAIFTDKRRNYFEEADYDNLERDLKRNNRVLTIATIDKDGKLDRKALIDYYISSEHEKDREYRMDYDAYALKNCEVILHTRFKGKEHGFLMITPKN